MPGVKGMRTGGRNKVPRALHVVRATFKPGRHDRPEVAAPAGTPEAPAGLSLTAREEWQRVSAALQAQGTLATVDGIALTNHVHLHALVARLETEVAALASLTVERVTVDGAGVEHREAKAHPLVSHLRAGRQALRQSLQEFGLTPASRTRVTPAAPVVSNPLDKFLHRKRR
jgi:P27 family predicted phage terminase small subunit